MRKILRNITLVDVSIPDTGVTIDASSSYEIVPRDYWLWAQSRDVIAQIAAGNLKVNDGEDDLQIRIGIGLIQDNQMVVNEFYTLVEDSDVLVGNGQILYYNDVFDTTDNVPGYIDEFIEDDVPTGPDYD